MTKSHQLDIMTKSHQLDIMTKSHQLDIIQYIKMRPGRFASVSSLYVRISDF